MPRIFGTFGCPFGSFGSLITNMPMKKHITPESAMSAKGGSASGGKNTLRAKLVAGATVLGLGMSLAFAGVAFAANLEYSVDTNVTFTDTAINFVIQSGSSATTLVVNATTVVVTVPLSDSFTVVSSNRSLATTGESVDSVTTATCNGVNAQTVVIAAPAGGAEVITITPGSSACSSGSGGGGGGGGGGGTPPP